VLELHVLATAGYAWRVAAETDVVELREERLLSAGPPLGAPSLQELEFSAVRPGEGRLVLECGRPWEATAPERLELNIVVGDGPPGA
jgi:predicted secreted protein